MGEAADRDGQRRCHHLTCPVGDTTASGSPSVRPSPSFRDAAIAMVGGGVDMVSVNAARSYHPANAVARVWAKHHHVGGQWSLSLS